MIGKLHAWAALPPGKQSPYALVVLRTGADVVENEKTAPPPAPRPGLELRSVRPLASVTVGSMTGDSVFVRIADSHSYTEAMNIIPCLTRG